MEISGRFRVAQEAGNAPSRADGAAIIADSPDEVRMRTREQLMQGASDQTHRWRRCCLTVQSSRCRHLYGAELRAAVEAAENWGTYVATHAYTPVSIQRSIAAGVKCIEHGHLMDEETAKLMAEKGIWLSTQPFLDEEGEGGAQQLGASEQAKMNQVIEGTDNVYRLAKKYHLKTAFGTDILFSAREAEQQGNRLPALIRWYTPDEALANGDVSKCRATCSVRSPQSIPRQAWRR
jgi:imidazolonepropionase-like amidohydrolase